MCVAPVCKRRAFDWNIFQSTGQPPWLTKFLHAWTLPFRSFFSWSSEQNFVQNTKRRGGGGGGGAAVVVYMPPSYAPSVVPLCDREFNHISLGFFYTTPLASWESGQQIPVFMFPFATQKCVAAQQKAIRKEMKKPWAATQILKTLRVWFYAER